MRDRYPDFEELRPTGEASHIPDTRLDDGCEGSPRRQRVATSAGGYPDAPTVTDGECRSCGVSVPDGQTKCRFCLTNHLDGDATSTNESASTTVLGETVCLKSHSPSDSGSLDRTTRTGPTEPAATLSASSPSRNEDREGAASPITTAS